MKPTLLIDGDQFLFKATVAVEKEVRWDDDNHVLGSNASEGFDVLMGALSKVQRDLGSTTCRIAFTQGDNFRKTIFADYKGNRQNTRKPLCYAEVKERLTKEFSCLGVDGLEADDIMGIWQTRDDTDTIIVSDDKDMKTIPGKLYRQGEMLEVSPEEADYNWLFQTLTGDTVDGFPGCPGIGAKGAEKVLKDEPGWPQVIKAYEKHNLTETDALIQARLARILRASDWDSANKRVILWAP